MSKSRIIAPEDLIVGGFTNLVDEWADDNDLNEGILVSSPPSPKTGIVYFADGVNWDPLGLELNSAYPVWWSGEYWRRLSESASGVVI